MSNQSTALAPDSPFAPVGRIAPLKKKAKRSSSPVPTGFYRRPGGTIWYWRRKIHGVPYNESTTFTDLKDAIRWADDKVEAIKYGNMGWSAKGIPTVKEYYDARPAYLKDGRPRNPDYDRQLLPFVEAHARVKLNQITFETCRAWIAKRLTTDTQYGVPFSPGTVRTECSHLRAFFNRAVGTGAKKCLRENPWRVADPDDRVKLPKKAIATRKLETEEQPEFLAALGSVGSVYARSGELERLAKIVLGSGLRREEICFLRSENVHHGAIHVPADIAKWGKPRTVPVGADVLALIDQQRAARGLEKKSEARLFEIPPVYLDELFLKASRAAQLKPTISPHDLRRTYASRMSFKVPPKVLQLLMGHADIKTTMDHYVDVKKAQVASVVAAAGSPIDG
jgi:integrase